MTPRQLVLSDIPAAMELCEEAGWNQTRDDWHMLVQRHPAACFALDINGELAATTTLVSYGTRLGWIGMVLTRQRFRRLGCARVLLKHAMDVAAEKGLKTLKLDATEMGAPLYASFGFREEQTVERWRSENVQPFPAVADSMRSAFPRQLDMQVFGADRTTLIHDLSSRGTCRTSIDSYVLTRPGRLCRYMGPCVAANRVIAEELIGQAIREGGTWYWDLLPGNSAAIDIARRFGFSPMRKLRRMWLGDILRGCDERVFAIAGFELG